MNNRPGSLPVHRNIIAEFQKDSVKGKAALQTFLKEVPPPPVISRLQLMAQLLDVCGEKPAILLISDLSSVRGEILDCLVQLSLKPAVVDKLIDFLGRKKYKLLREMDKGLLYKKLAFAYNALQDEEGSLHYFLKALGHPHLPPIERHLVHYNVGAVYCSNGDMQKATAHFQEALRMEKTEKELRKIGNQQYVVALFLEDYYSKQFQPGSEFNCLKLLILLEPQDPRILEAVSTYLDQTLSLASPEQVCTCINQFFYFKKIYPILQTKLTQFSDRLLQLPEEVCCLKDKVDFLYRLGQFEQAIKLAPLALQKNENDPDLLSCLAGSFHMLGRKEEAFKCYQKVLLCPLIAPHLQQIVSRELAMLSSQLGNSMDSTEYFAQVNPNDFYVQLIQATTAFHDGKRNKAKKLFHDLKTTFPDRQVEIDSYFNIFWGNEKEGDFNKEASRFILINQAQIRFSEGDYATAEKIALFLISKDPSDSIMITLILAKVYEAQGRWEKALDLYLMLNEKQNGQYSFKIAKANYELHQYEPAEEIIWSFLKDPNSHSKENSQKREQVLHLLRVMYQEASCFKDAITTLSKALEDLTLSLSDPEKQYIHFSLATLYKKRGQIKETEEALQQALAFGENDDPSFNRFLGLFYYETNRKEEAIEPLKKALSFYSKDIKILFPLGAALYISAPSQRKKALALDYFSTVLRLDPSLFPEIQELRLSEIDSTTLDELIIKDKEIEEPPVPAAETGLRLSPVVEVEEKDSPQEIPRMPFAPAVLTPEQEAHQAFQKRKQQLREAASDSKDDDSQESGWNLPSGFLREGDPHVFKLAIAHHLKEESHLYAFLDVDALRKTYPDENLISRWRTLLEQGNVVGKKGQQGIRFFNKREREQSGYDAKLKLLGLFGNARAYGKLEVQGNKKLLRIYYSDLKSH